MGQHTDLTLRGTSSMKIARTTRRGSQLLLDRRSLGEPDEEILRSQPMRCSADCHMAGRHRMLVLSSGEVPTSRHRSAHRATLGAPCLCMAPPRTHTQVTLLGGSVQWPDSHLWSILPYKEVINSHDWKEYGHQGHYGQQFPKHGAGGGVITWGYSNRGRRTPQNTGIYLCNTKTMEEALDTPLSVAAEATRKGAIPPGPHVLVQKKTSRMTG